MSNNTLVKHLLYLFEFLASVHKELYKGSPNRFRIAY
jgi:hypothetical protein